MNEAVLVALITGVFSIVGVVITNSMSNKKIEQKLEIAQAITDTKIEELTREVREHNNFARRVPVVEKELEHIQKEILTLESYHK